MPTYDYKCKKCGHKFEGFAKMSDPCPPCPKLMTFPLHVEPCEGETEKVFTSAAPVHFQGGGWASDGYSSKK